MERYGDCDEDGFIEYSGRARNGLLHQGWKDADDAVFHADGSAAEGPVALCEVQAYAYGAWKSAARIAAVLGLPDLESRFSRRAEELRAHFEEAFWCKDLSLHALALDGRKHPCRVRISNAGQCLFTGIASEDRAARVAEALLRPDSFSGWGVRTLAMGEPRWAITRAASGLTTML
jgi:glycogen debranching enzyme